MTLPSFQPAWKVGSSFDARKPRMTAEGLTRQTLPAETGGGFYGEAIRGRSAPTLTEPASSNQSRALIKSTLNCLCDSSTGLEELLRERPERLAKPNAPPQGASVKERELSRL